MFFCMKIAETEKKWAVLEFDTATDLQSDGIYQEKMVSLGFQIVTYIQSLNNLKKSCQRWNLKSWPFVGNTNILPSSYQNAFRDEISYFRQKII